MFILAEVSFWFSSSLFGTSVQCPDSVRNVVLKVVVVVRVFGCKFTSNSVRIQFGVLVIGVRFGVLQQFAISARCLQVLNSFEFKK